MLHCARKRGREKSYRVLEGYMEGGYFQALFTLNAETCKFLQITSSLTFSFPSLGFSLTVFLFLFLVLKLQKQRECYT